MAMALTTVAESAWFEIDARYIEEMAERRRLLAEQHEDVFGALPISDAARAETLRELVANLTTHAPQWFSRDGDILYNALTGEDLGPRSPTMRSAGTRRKAGAGGPLHHPARRG